MKYDVERINKVRRRRGEEPLPVHGKAGRPVSVMPSKAEVVRTYVRRGLSLRQAAAELGCSKDTAARVLQAYGLERRPRVRPKLQKSDLAAIMNERRPDIWTTRPWREIAAKYGVSVKTLERFIAAAKARGVTPRTLKDIARREWKWLLRK